MIGSRYYQHLKSFFKRSFPRVAALVQPRKTPIKFMIAGIGAGTIHLVVLYLLVEWAHLYYLVSTTLALVLAWSVSFVFQKYWTFRDVSEKGLAQQTVLYFLMQGGGLVVNTFLMYLLVEWAQVWYLVAQIVTSLAIALVTFIINKRYIFQTV